MQSTKSINHKILALALLTLVSSFSSKAQVLIGWDSANLAGQFTAVAINNGATLAPTGITYELGFWANTIDLTSKATIISGFTAWGTQNGRSYSGTVGEDGLGDGLLGRTNGNAVIPTSWVGVNGNTVGILFGRDTTQWGAFRFALYPPSGEGAVGSSTILANQAPPSAPAQMDYFSLDLIGTAGVIAGSYQSSNVLDFVIFGDQDSGTPGNQYIQSTSTISLVPEPSTGALMMIGAAGLVALRRLRKV